MNQLSIGMRAPDFTANSSQGEVRMSDYAGRWLVFFSHPGDFTPVCTTEYLAFSNDYDKFLDRNTQLLGLSIDSNPSHLAWLNAIYMATGTTVPFPVIADRDARVAQLYGMVSSEEGNMETMRNVFLIDPNQTIRAILVYPTTNGRSIEEIIRLLTALQETDENKVITPANWRFGQPTMVPAPTTYNSLAEVGNNQPPGLVCHDWFWCYDYTSLPETGEDIEAQSLERRAIMNRQEEIDSGMMNRPTEAENNGRMMNRTMNGQTDIDSGMMNRPTEAENNNGMMNRTMNGSFNGVAPEDMTEQDNGEYLYNNNRQTDVNIYDDYDRKNNDNTASEFIRKDDGNVSQTYNKSADESDANHNPPETNGWSRLGG